MMRDALFMDCFYHPVRRAMPGYAGTTKAVSRQLVASLSLSLLPYPILRLMESRLEHIHITLP